MKRNIFILTLLFLITGCIPNEELVETLLEEQEISLIWRGKQQVIYNPDTYQLGYNSKRCEYRVYDDRLAYWFIVRCSDPPVSEGQTITADISWTGVTKTHEFSGIKLMVKKVDSSGYVWLWSNTDSIGIILRNQ
jgi:hypothetical protein